MYGKYEIPPDVTREKGSGKEGRRQKPACATLSIEAANAFVLCASSRAKVDRRWLANPSMEADIKQVILLILAPS